MLSLKKKTRIFLWAIVLILLLSACSATPMTLGDIEGRSAYYRATAYINKGGLLAVARIVQESPFECTVTYAAPAHLKGFETVFTEDEIELNYNGLTCELISSALPHTAAARAAVDIIRQSFTDTELPLTKTDQGLVAQGENTAGAFTLAIDPENGAITKLLLPAEELEIAFTNFIYLDM